MQSELKIKDNCKYFLHGHYPISAKSYIRELSDITSAGKDPDRYGQGEELQSFERELADFFGFEDCIFLQSGWYVGDATMDLSTKEIVDYVNRVVID